MPSGDLDLSGNRGITDVDGTVAVDAMVDVGGGVRLHVRRFAPEQVLSRRFAPEQVLSRRFAPEQVPSRRFAPEQVVSRRFAPEHGPGKHVAAEVAGRPFLLVHGLSSNARLWDAVSRRLAAHGHQATAVDLRSHGDSDAPDGGYDTGTAAADVAAVANALGISGAVVAGQSWGGNVVLRLAAEHPGVAAALALVDGGWFSPSTEFSSWEAVESALRPPEIDGRPATQMREFLASMHPDWSDEAVDATMANLAVMADGTLRRRLSIEHHMQIVRSMYDDPPRRYYPAVDVPVLLMPALPTDGTTAEPRRRRVAETAAALADATIVEYVGGDHDLHAQQPERVADDLLALAARLDGASP